MNFGVYRCHDNIVQQAEVNYFIMIQSPL